MCFLFDPAILLTKYFLIYRDILNSDFQFGCLSFFSAKITGLTTKPYSKNTFIPKCAYCSL